MDEGYHLAVRCLEYLAAQNPDIQEGMMNAFFKKSDEGNMLVVWVNKKILWKDMVRPKNFEEVPIKYERHPKFVSGLSK